MFRCYIFIVRGRQGFFSGSKSITRTNACGNDRSVMRRVEDAGGPLNGTSVLDFRGAASDRGCYAINCPTVIQFGGIRRLQVSIAEILPRIISRRCRNAAWVSRYASDARSATRKSVGRGKDADYGELKVESDSGRGSPGPASSRGRSNPSFGTVRSFEDFETRRDL